MNEVEPRASDAVRSGSVETLRLTAGLVLLAVIWSIWGTALVYRLHPRPGVLHDFAQEWTSARNYLTDQPIYLPLEKSVPIHFEGGKYRGGVKVNAHPPVSVLLALPFAHLNYRQALLAWNLASLALLVASVWILLASREFAFSKQSWVVVATLLLVCNPLAQQVNQGQLNLVILFMLVVGWKLMARGQDSLAGTVLGVATAIKLFPGFLFFFLLAERRIRAIVWGVAAFVAVNVLAGVVLGFESFHAFVFEVLPQLREFNERWTNLSAAGYWSKNLIGARGHVTAIMSLPWLAHFATLSSVLGVTGAVFFIVPRDGQPAQRNLVFALAVVGMLIVSPITWTHYLILLLLPGIIFWQYAATRNRRVLAAVLIVLLGIDPFWIWNAVIGFGEFDPKRSPTAAQTITLISFQSYALVALFLLLFSECKRASREPRVRAEA